MFGCTAHFIFAIGLLKTICSVFFSTNRFLANALCFAMFSGHNERLVQYRRARFYLIREVPVFRAQYMFYCALIRFYHILNLMRSNYSNWAAQHD